MRFKGTSINSFSARIAASRAHPLLAYLSDMSRRSLRGFLRFITEKQISISAPNFRLLVLLLTCCALRPAIAADDVIVADESAVEAAFLYNFALFTEWPDLPANEFRICVLGSGPVFAALESVKKKQIKEHPISVMNISSATQVESCQVLFVGRYEHASIGKLARQIGNTPVLVVAEEDGYDPKNVIILLVAQQGRIGFKINRTAAQANSLTVSSKLLKLAQQVY
jgi:hypothetical protein